MLLIAHAVSIYNKASKQRMFIDNLPDNINVRDFQDFQKYLDALNKKLSKLEKQIMKGNHGIKI